MKKILLFNLVLGFTLFCNAQLIGPTTPTGPVLNASGQNVGPTGCIFTATNPACPRICRNSFLIVSPNPSNPSQRRIIFNFFNPTNGNKNIRIVIRCGTTLLVDQCMDVSGNDNLRFYKQYDVVCANLNALTVFLTPYTGNDCGGFACGPTEGSVAGAPLPVEFSSFTASRNHTNVMLKWATASEQNNTGFFVERNMNGTWQEVSFIPSQATGGNSSSELIYTYNDLNSTKGISEYRIKQVDFDAQSKYSEVRMVRGDGQAGKITVYPNPTNDGKVNVVFEDATVTREVSVMDMSGRVVKQLKNIINNNITIDNLTPGIYSLRVFVPSTGEQSVEKIVVNKR